MDKVVLLIALSVLAIPSALWAEEATTFALVGGHIVGYGKATLIVRDGRIVQIPYGAPGSTLRVMNAAGHYSVPAFIDSDVHLAYRFSAAELALGGIAARVDLAAPISFLSQDLKPLRTLRTGSMLTTMTGSPTQSWGSDGYGLEISGVQPAREVDRLHAAGARVIKIPVGDATGGGCPVNAEKPIHTERSGDGNHWRQRPYPQ